MVSIHRALRSSLRFVHSLYRVRALADRPVGTRPRGAGDKALHRLMYEETRRVSLATEEMVLHLCHRRSCIQPSHLDLGNDADNADDRSRDSGNPICPLSQVETNRWRKGFVLRS